MVAMHCFPPRGWQVGSHCAVPLLLQSSSRSAGGLPRCRGCSINLGCNTEHMWCRRPAPLGTVPRGEPQWLSWGGWATHRPVHSEVT